MIALTTVARGQDSRIAEPRRVVVRTAEEWTTLWAAHAGPGSAAPAIDFSAAIVAAAFAGERPSAGYSVDVTGAVEEAGGVRLFVDERGPGSGMAAAQILTSPFHIVSLARMAGQVAWTESSRDSRGAGRDGGAGSREARETPVEPAGGVSSTGLKPTTAAALSYLAGPVSGATILFAETRSEFVRFHAWQAILGIGTGALAVFGCYVLAVTSLFVSATAVPAMVRVATALWFALVVVWAVCIWQALSGRTWKLPVVGEVAARRAARPRSI